MVCDNCGKVVSGAAYKCPYCGEVIRSYRNKYNPFDKVSFGYSFICFLFPLVGLILYLVWKDKYPIRASSCGVSALISVISFVCLYIFALAYANIVIEYLTKFFTNIK